MRGKREEREETKKRGIVGGWRKRGEGRRKGEREKSKDDIKGQGTFTYKQIIITL